MFLPMLPLAITFLLYTARDAEPRLEPMAAPKQSQLKDSSDALARPTPPMIGRREAYTCQGITSPINRKFRSEETTGSEALTMWPNDTAPAKKATTAPTCVARCPNAEGESVTASFTVSFGTLRILRSQRGTKINQPKAICHKAHAQGKGY